MWLGSFIILQAFLRHCGVVSKLDDGVGVVQSHAIVAEQGVQQRAETPGGPLREYSRGLRTHPWGAPMLRVSVEEVLLPILTACGLPVRKSRIQMLRVKSRPRALSLVASLEGTIVLNADL